MTTTGKDAPTDLPLWPGNCTHVHRGQPRCYDCQDRHRVYNKARIAARRRQLELNPSMRPHGDKNTYNVWGCRCRPCTDAANAWRYTYPRSRSGKGGHFLRQSQSETTAVPFGREWLNDTQQTG